MKAIPSIIGFPFLTKCNVEKPLAVPVDTPCHLKLQLSSRSLLRPCCHQQIGYAPYPRGFPNADLPLRLPCSTSGPNSWSLTQWPTPPHCPMHLQNPHPAQHSWGAGGGVPQGRISNRNRQNRGKHSAKVFVVFQCCSAIQQTRHQRGRNYEEQQPALRKCNKKTVGAHNSYQAL